MANDSQTKNLNKQLSRLFIAVLVVFFIGDIGRKVALYMEQDFVRYTAISKGFVLLLYAVVLTYYFKTYKTFGISVKIITCLFLLTLTFIIGQYVLKDDIPIVTRLGMNLVYLSRILFLPLSFSIFLPLLKDEVKLQSFFKIFEIIFYIYALAIVCGFVFNIWIFETYRWSQRFGYLGLYNSHNQASFFFMFMISIYYYKSLFLNQRFLKLIAAIIVGCLIGTKKFYLFLILLFIFDIIYFKRYKKIHFLAVITVIIGTGLFFFKAINTFIQVKFSLLFEIYREQGALTSLSSLRNVALNDTIDNVVITKWSLLNYIFGGPQFYDHRPEMEFIDVYMFFGVLGVIFFIWFTYILITYFRPNTFMYFLLSSYILIGGLAGGFFISANQPLIFLLTFALLGFLHKFKTREV